MDISRRRARREAQRRRRSRRRALGLAATVAVAVAALLGALVLGAGGSSRPTSPTAERLSGGHRSHRAGRVGHQPRDVTAAILMYHVINPPPPGAKFPGLYVSKQEFAAQMQALERAGFHAVTMDQLLAHWRTGAPLPPGRPIVVSFDNGYESQYSNALPVLRAMGWVGVENIQLTGLPPSQGGFGEGQVQRLLAAGWELDTQGFSHADLITLSGAALRYQVAVARREVKRRYHVPANWFCYPSGHYDASVIAEVRAAGYAGSTTVVPGLASPSEDPYRLPRLRVLGGTSPSALIAQIQAAASAAPPPASYGSGG